MPERFEIYIVYKRRYINTLPFISFPFLIQNFGCSSNERVFLSHTAVVNLYSARPHIKCRFPPNQLSASHLASINIVHPLQFE